VAGYRLERCGSCGLVFVNPRPTEQDLAGLYDAKNGEAQADFYARTVSPAQIAEYDRILKDVAEFVPRGARLLDLGCAAGYFMQQAGGAGFDAHGVDIAPWVEQISGLRGVRNVRACRLLDAGFEDGSFDVVHSSQVFEHLPRPTEELHEIHRVLRPGGLLYINVPNYQCLSIVLGRDDFELNTPPEHVTYFTPRTIARLVATAGFDVLRVASYGGLKWENLLGRPIRSEIAEAVRSPNARGVAAAPAAAARPPRVPSIGGRLVRTFFYKWLNVGMTLEIFAVKPAATGSPDRHRRTVSGRSRKSA
jgi:SAM-dependent methyltransferase